MPELPEVETTRRGVTPHLQGQLFLRVIVRDHRLRWPIPKNLPAKLKGQTVKMLQRRGKYLIFFCGTGAMILHLGMSGSLRIIPSDQPPGKHDHVDFVLSSGLCLRFRDPRRFGAILWCDGNPLEHKLLAHLGPEPLEKDFNGDYLFDKSRGRTLAVKNFIMDSKIVVGVGNIYANEALFFARIRPTCRAGKISRKRYQLLADAIKNVLDKAINAGGTTLKDFTQSNGNPGYFAQQLSVYGRAALPCVRCSTPIKMLQLGQRATYYCTQCQQ